MVKNLDATHLGFSPFHTGWYQVTKTSLSVCYSYNIERKQTSFISKTWFHPVISQHWCRISLLFAESSFLFVYILKWQLVNVYKKSYIRSKYSCTSCSFHVTVSDIKQNCYFRGPSCELVGHVILKLNKEKCPSNIFCGRGTRLFSHRLSYWSTENMVSKLNKTTVFTANYIITLNLKWLTPSKFDRIQTTAPFFIL